jgi:hypothetical protein
MRWNRQFWKIWLRPVVEASSRGTREEGRGTGVEIGLAVGGAWEMTTTAMQRFGSYEF